MARCEKIDNKYLLGLPATQFLARGCLFRGPADIAASQLSVTLREKAEVAKELAETQARIQSLRQRLDEKSKAADELQQESVHGIVTQDAPAELIEERLQQSMSPEHWRSRGITAIRKAEQQAQAIQVATTDDMERIIAKVTEMSAEFAQSDTFRMAITRVEEARLKGMEQGIVALEELRRSERVQQALARGQEVAFQILDNPAVQSAARASLEQGSSMVEELQQNETVQQALATGQKFALQVLESEAVQVATRNAAEVVEQVRESEARRQASATRQELVDQDTVQSEDGRQIMAESHGAEERSRRSGSRGGDAEEAGGDRGER